MFTRSLFSLYFTVITISLSYGQKGKLVDTKLVSESVSKIRIDNNHNYIAIGESPKNPLDYDSKNEEFNISLFSSNDLDSKKILKGHLSGISSLEFSSDSEKLLSSDKDGIIILWDLLKDTQISKIKLKKWVHKALFTSSNNEFVTTLKYEKKGFLYDLSGNLIFEFDVGKQINDFIINQNKNEIIFGCYDEIQVWSLISRKKIKTIPYKGIMTMEFNHNFSEIAIGRSSGEISLLSPELEPIGMLIGHFKPVLDISYSFDDKMLCSGSSDQTIRSWNLSKSKETLQLVNQHKGTVYAVEFISEKNGFISGGKNNQINFWK